MNWGTWTFSPKPPGSRCQGQGEQRPAVTYFLHRGAEREEALSEQLLHHLVIGLDLRDHVTGDEAEPGTGLPAVEAVHIFVTVNLEPQKEGGACDWLLQKYSSSAHGAVLASADRALMPSVTWTSLQMCTCPRRQPRPGSDSAGAPVTSGLPAKVVAVLCWARD